VVVVAILVAAIISVALWMQSIELRLPISFYRTRRGTVSVCSLLGLLPFAACFCRSQLTWLSKRLH
jgi:hypothetical protein